MDEKLFKMIDEEFLCVNCGNNVYPLGYTARDHCNKCLCSLHVDNNPGDRSSNCNGILRPISIEKSPKEMKIVYLCDKCNIKKRNKLASDDDMNKILEIMKNYAEEKR